jgi:hypothetical protein
MKIGAPRRPARAWLLVPLSAGLLFACTDRPPAPRPDAGPAPDGVAAPPAKRTATLIHLQGEVHVKRPGAPDWQAATPGMELLVQDKVRTLRDAFATIQFEHGGLLRLEPESLISVTDLQLEPRSQARRSTFTLMEGSIEAELDPIDTEGSEFRIRTPSAEASVARREVSFQ